MRQFIVASHAHFASGIVESIGLLSGERENVHALSMYVDGNEDLVKEAAAILDALPRTMKSSFAPTCSAAVSTTSSPRSSRRVPTRIW